MIEKKESKICKAHHHFTFPWQIDYRCGQCFHYFGENLKNISYIKCPKCGYVNDIINSTSMLSIDEYPKIIQAIENEKNEIENEIEKDRIVKQIISNNMAQETVAKKKVDKFVFDVACDRGDRLTASYISKNIDVDLDFVKKRLIELSKDDKLFTNFELMCDSPKCESKTIKTYSKIEDIPIGEIIVCPECGEEFEVTEEHIWVTFSPNKSYYDEEMCMDTNPVKKRCESII